MKVDSPSINSAKYVSKCRGALGVAFRYGCRHPLRLALLSQLDLAHAGQTSHGFQPVDLCPTSPSPEGGDRSPLCTVPVPPTPPGRGTVLAPKQTPSCSAPPSRSRTVPLRPVCPGASLRRPHSLSRCGIQQRGTDVTVHFDRRATRGRRRKARSGCKGNPQPGIPGNAPLRAACSGKATRPCPASQAERQTLERFARLPAGLRLIAAGAGSNLHADPASRRRPCPWLSLHLHEVVKGGLHPQAVEHARQKKGGPVSRPP